MRGLATAVLVFSLSSSVSLSATGTLEKGETAEHTFELGADDLKTGISVTWKDTSAVFDIALVSPSGALLQGSMTGLEVNHGPVSTQFVLCPRLPESVGWEGTWTVRVRLIDTHRKRPSVSYHFEVEGSSVVKLKLNGLGGVQRAGDEVRLGVRVRPEQKGQKIQVDSCAARVLSADNADPIELDLTGDGELFTGAFSWPAAGDYRVVVTVRGTCAEGKSFERESLEEVQVRAAR
jgi:hypothetical protein